MIGKIEAIVSKIGVDELVQASSILGGFGTFVALLWAFLVYFRNIRNEKTARFREQIAPISAEFGRLSMKFETHAIIITNSLFKDCKSFIEFRDFVEKCFSEPSAEECENRLLNGELTINRHVLNSMPEEAMDASMSMRVKAELLIAPIAHFSQLSHALLRSSSNIIFRTYRENLGMDFVTGHLLESIELVYSNRDLVKGEKNIDDIVNAIQEVFFVKVVTMTNRVKVVEVFNQLDFVVRNYTNVLHRLNDRDLWRLQKLGRKSFGLIGTKSTDNIRGILSFENAHLKVDHSDAIQEVNRIETLLDRR